jgi:hypothetical protein
LQHREVDESATSGMSGKPPRRTGRGRWSRPNSPLYGIIRIGDVGTERWRPIHRDQLVDAEWGRRRKLPGDAESEALIHPAASVTAKLEDRDYEFRRFNRHLDRHAAGTISSGRLFRGLFTAFETG